jgi:hypothetical protein
MPSIINLIMPLEGNGMLQEHEAGNTHTKKSSSKVKNFVFVYLQSEKSLIENSMQRLHLLSKPQKTSFPDCSSN